MQNQTTWNNPLQQLAHIRLPRQLVVGGILAVALIAFELFNFDTTKFALTSLLGDVSFLGLGWAAILATAFCAIDFAGLVRLFTPERGADEPKEVWYLMGAWLLGATMNAMMTWWAVSLTLLNHNFGNEVLSREQLLTIVPIFVAVLVWLTRILFIGSLTVAGERILFGDGRPRRSGSRSRKATTSSGKTYNQRRSPVTSGRSRSPRPRPGYQAQNAETEQAYRSPAAGSAARYSPRPATLGRATHNSGSDRLRQRPPRPNGSASNRGRQFD